MDIEFSKIIIPAISALAGGLLATVVAPWVNWGIEKKKKIRKERKDLLTECRKILNNELTGEEFSVHPVYSTIRPYLSPDTIKAVERNTSIDSIVVSQNARHYGLNPYKQEVLDDLAIQGKKWGLI